MDMGTLFKLYYESTDRATLLGCPVQFLGVS